MLIYEKVNSIPPKNKVDGFLCVSRCFQEQNILREIADVIVQSSQSGTSSKYDNGKWVLFCSERNFSPFEMIINQILIFLYDLCQSGVG